MLRFYCVIITFRKVGVKMKNNIRKLRKEKNMTLKQLSEKLGIASNTLSQYETGKREPKLKTWHRIANYFDVSVPYLQGISIDKECIHDFSKFVNNNILDFGNNFILDTFEKYNINLSDRDVELIQQGFILSSELLKISEKTYISLNENQINNSDVSKTLNNEFLKIKTIITDEDKRILNNISNETTDKN